MSTDTDSEDIEFESLSMTEKRPLVPEPKPKRSSNVQNDDAQGQVQRTPQFVYTLAFFAAIGGFLFGYDTGVVSGAMLLLQPEFELDSVWEEMVVSATILFAAIFALVGGPLNDKIGRKAVTVVASLVFTGGAVLLGVAQNKVMLLAGRSILGVGIGLASMTVPMYIAECAPVHLRGRLVTVNNLFITGGQFVASVLDGVFSYDKKNGWRWMLGLAAVPSAVQFVGFLFLPESPRWLIKHGRITEAREVLQKCRGTEDVEEELNTVKELCEEDQRLMEETGKENILMKILRTPSVRRAVLVGSGLQLIQQVSGINTVMYYSATIIRMTGVRDTSLAIWLAAMTAGVNFVFTILGVWLVERIGRRPLILGSLVGVLISLVVLAVGFQLAAFHSPPVTFRESNDTCSSYSWCEDCIENSDCGFCYTEIGKSVVNGSCVTVATNLTDGAGQGRCDSDPLTPGTVWAHGYCPTDYSWMGLLGLVMYLMFFAPGMGPMPWTINSEIYPLWARSTGNAISTATNWFFNLAVAMSFLTLTESITKYGTYWLFVGIVFCGLVFIMAALPETKGRSLEEVETLFQGSICPGFSRKSPNILTSTQPSLSIGDLTKTTKSKGFTQSTDPSAIIITHF
eukprot:XP_019918355.1 PREDICTED: proton myo-inositol cotransporter-like isoform X1 [Crassostrea gigas]